MSDRRVERIGQCSQAGARAIDYADRTSRTECERVGFQFNMEGRNPGSARGLEQRTRAEDGLLDRSNAGPVGGKHSVPGAEIVLKADQHQRRLAAFAGPCTDSGGARFETAFKDGAAIALAAPVANDRLRRHY